MDPGTSSNEAIALWSADTVQDVLDAVPDAMLAVDDAGLIVMANGQAERLFGYEHRGLIGRPIESLIPERVQALHMAHRAGYFRAPKVRPMHSGSEFAGRRSDGSEVPVDISLSWVETDHGSLALCAIRDISSRRRAEIQRRELEELNRMKTELLHILSHEIFTPITTIQGTAITLLHAPGELRPETRHELTVGLAHAVARLRRLMRNLDVAARLEENALATSMPLVRVGRILNGAVGEFPDAIDEGTIVVTAPSEAQERRIPADVELATRAISIVIENSLEYSNGKPVDIDLTVVRGEILILISDRGPGIPRQLQDHVFDAFSQADSSAIRSHEGLGLGLFIARGIMRTHGGEVDASPRDGGGTTFALRFPLGA
ncbi:MAG: PAS domain-containing sensor histidine kinase [Actinomycetota bacterium]